jgi:hypothetical protein
MRPTTLYQAVNRSNGKRYIGITVRPLDVRKRRHWQDARSGSQVPFHRALLKHGLNGFDWMPLAVLCSQEEAAETEVRAIASLRPEYNAHPGGALGPFPPNAETIKRIAEGHFKGVVCLNTGKFFQSAKAAAAFCGRKSISSIISGREISANGYYFVFSNFPLDDETRTRILAEKMARKNTFHARIGQKKRKRVICINTMLVYESCVAAALATGVSKECVSECCRGRAIKIHGFRFAFEADYLAGKFDHARTKRTNGLERRVVCIETGETYPSVCAAARAHNSTASNVRMTCQGKRRVAGGVGFKYEDKA